MTQMNLWNRNRISDIENTLGAAKGERVGGGEQWEAGVSTCELLHRERVNYLLSCDKL